MKPLLILLLLFTSCNPYRELKKYNKKLEKWDEYFKKEQLKNKEDEGTHSL
mgnify:CR=1 FL=1